MRVFYLMRGLDVKAAVRHHAAGQRQCELGVVGWLACADGVWSAVGELAWSAVGIASSDGRRGLEFHQRTECVASQLPKQTALGTT